MVHLKQILTLAFILCLTGFVVGKEKDVAFYPAASISPAMKKDAYAVCREYNHEFELIDYGKAIERVHKVMTILEEGGDQFGIMMLYYNKSQNIKSISGKIYNAAGLLEEKLKNAAIQDVNSTSAGAIYDDSRLKVANFKIKTYPYTVEYDYEIEHDGLIGYPDFQPIAEYRISVEKSSFRVSYPEKFEIRIREINMPAGSRTEKSENGRHIDEWELDSLAAWREEPHSPELYMQTSRVVLGPTHFFYEGTNGSMNSWQEFGKWTYDLIIGLDQLPDLRQTEIRNLVSEVKDTLKVIETLYTYMQKRTRYVGIQQGIGGFRPFPAETVDRLGYGDCKALSNYMKSLLNCVGIPSIYVRVGAGQNQGITWTDFPTVYQNNHIILCVPLQKDTIWLECTSQTSPCGYLGRSVEGRKVLLITPEGGKLTRTPMLKADKNLQIRTAKVEVSADGAMKADVKTNYSGYQYDNVSSMFDMSKEDQEKELLEDISIPGTVMSSFGYDVKKEKIPQALESMTLSSPKYATKTGPRLFIPLNILNQRKSTPDKVENRKMPTVQRFSYVDKDSIVFQLPKGYQVETVPKGKTLSTEYGEYKSSITVENGQAVYVRELKVNRGTWPKENYKQLIDFYAGIVSGDKAKLVLKEQQP